jgi:hypothetical protein
MQPGRPLGTGFLQVIGLSEDVYLRLESFNFDARQQAFGNRLFAGYRPARRYLLRIDSFDEAGSGQAYVRQAGCMETLSFVLPTCGLPGRRLPRSPEPLVGMRRMQPIRCTPYVST